MSTQHNLTGRSPSASTRHLRQHDLATRWGMSVRTLERWRSQHQGPAFLKLGGGIAYRIEDVEAFEAARLREGSAA